MLNLPGYPFANNRPETLVVPDDAPEGYSSGHPAVCYLGIDQIQEPSGGVCSPVDPFELIAFLYQEMPNPASIPPLPVRFDSTNGKFTLLPGGSGPNPMTVLAAARKLGLSSLPCLDLGGKTSRSSSVVPQGKPDGSSRSEEATYSPTQLNSLLRELDPAVRAMAWKRGCRLGPAATRIVDDEDWSQAAVEAISRLLQCPGDLALTDASEVKRYVQGILHHQAVSAARRARGSEVLPAQLYSGSCSVLDDLIAAEDYERGEHAARQLHSRLLQGEQTLTQLLANLPAEDAKALQSWLAGRSLRQAGLPLGKIRRLVKQLRVTEELAIVLKQLRDELEAIYQLSVPVATGVSLGRLARLLPAWRGRVKKKVAHKRHVSR